MAAQPYKAFGATFTLSPACPITDGVYHVIGQLTPEIYEVIAVARIGALEAGGTKMVMAIGDEEGVEPSTNGFGDRRSTIGATGL